MARSKVQKRVSNPGTSPIEVKMDTLIQGVSQQPDYLRAMGQGTEQINGWSSPVEGLTKRNPSRYIGKLRDGSIEDFFLDIIEVSTEETYQVIIWPDEPSDVQATKNLRLEIWSNQTAMDDTQVSVNGTDLTYEVKNGVPGWKVGPGSYLYNAAALDDKELYKGYVLASSGQVSLLLNRNVVTAWDDVKTNPARNEGMVFIQGVTYNITYTLYDDDVQIAQFTTPKADDDNNRISTDLVADGLYAGIDTSVYTRQITSYTIYLKRKDGGAMNLRLEDSRSNTLGRAFTGEVAEITKPAFDREGQVPGEGGE